MIMPLAYIRRSFGVDQRVQCSFAGLLAVPMQAAARRLVSRTVILCARTFTKYSVEGCSQWYASAWHGHRLDSARCTARHCLAGQKYSQSR